MNRDKKKNSEPVKKMNDIEKIDQMDNQSFDTTQSQLIDVHEKFNSKPNLNPEKMQNDHINNDVNGDNDTLYDSNYDNIYDYIDDNHDNEEDYEMDKQSQISDANNESSTL